MMVLNGDFGGLLVKLSLLFGDVVGLLWVVIGVLVVLHWCDAIGVGAHVDVLLFDSFVSFSFYFVQMYLVMG